MGNSANYADVVEESTVEEYCREELQALKDAVAAADGDWEDFAREAMYEEIKNKKAKKLYGKLCDRFQERTGLVLMLNDHSEQDADSRDDVTGVFWSVDNVWVMTPYGERMKDKIERKWYVEFG